MFINKEKNNKLLINDNLKFEILNNFIKLMNLNLLEEYEKHLAKSYGVGADEIILKYLDSLLYIYEAKNKLDLKKNVVIMNNKQKKKLIKALNNSKSYKTLFNDTNLLLNIIYSKETQDIIVFELLKKQENKETNRINNKVFSKNTSALENSNFYFNQFNHISNQNNNYLLMT